MCITLRSRSWTGMLGPMTVIVSFGEDSDLLGAVGVEAGDSAESSTYIDLQIVNSDLFLVEGYHDKKVSALTALFIVK